MKYKSCPAFKVADSASTDSGEFEAIVSVFGNVDHAGDVVMPGAFTDTLAAWKSSGDPIPVLWSHRMDDPRFSIGTVLDAEELEPHDSRIPEWADEWLKNNGGLWVKGRLDTGADATDVATAARGLLRKRLVKQFSYAYDVVDAGWGTVGGQDAYELRKLSIYEISPTQIGCNNLTQLIGAKASALMSSASDAGNDPAVMRHLSSTMDDARKAFAALGKALAECKPDSSTDTSDSGTVKDEEPAAVKSEEPARRDDGSMRRLISILEAEMEYAA